jgi:hypothetical protein
MSGSEHEWTVASTNKGQWAQMRATQTNGRTSMNKYEPRHWAATTPPPPVEAAAAGAMRTAVISLVLVYAGTPTIFANFHTFIQLYLIIFHHYITLYIATLHCNLCCNSTSHFYVTPTLHCYHLAPSHRHCLMSLHMTSQVIGPSWAVGSTTP